MSITQKNFVGALASLFPILLGAISFSQTAQAGDAYTAVVSCEINGQHVGVMACFENTELVLTIDNKTTVYKQWQLLSIGSERDDGLLISLPKHFYLRAQNSSAALVLSVRIVDTAGKTIYQDQAARYRSIKVSN